MHLRTGPFVTRLEISIPHVVNALHLLYAHYPVVDGVGLPDFHVRVGPPPGVRRWWGRRAVFLRDGVMLAQPFPRRVAFPLLEWGWNWCVSSSQHQYLIIHAGVVERGGRALIFPAPPGSGKSTLCAALIHRGWRLLSDELTLVRPRDGLVVPMPRPVSLKRESIELIRDLVPGAVFGPLVPDTHKGTVTHIRPPADSVARDQEPGRPGWVVFPSYQAGAPARLELLPRGRALLRLAKNTFNYTILGVTGFETLAGLIESCGGYDLTYGDLSEALSLVDRLRASADRFSERGRP